MITIVRFQRLETGFGVEVTGLDLREAPRAPTVRTLDDALAEHHLLVIRTGHQYAPDDQVRWTACFGALEMYPSSIAHQLPDRPEVLRLTNVPGRGYLNSAEFWHQDGSFMEFPTYLSFFNLVERPESGGATVFTNAYGAYERLPDDLRSVVETRYSIQKNGRRHALLRRDPLTGCKSLFVNVGYTDRIEGMSPGQSAEFIDRIDRILTSGESYSHDWQVGDLVVADNTALAHRATEEEVKGIRTMHRTCVEGTSTF